MSAAHKRGHRGVGRKPGGASAALGALAIQPGFEIAPMRSFKQTRDHRVRRSDRRPGAFDEEHFPRGKSGLDEKPTSLSVKPSPDDTSAEKGPPGVPVPLRIWPLPDTSDL